MSRLRAAGHDPLGGVPELWRIALDQLANDPSLPDARVALGRHLQSHLSDTDLVERARSACLNAQTGETPLAALGCLTAFAPEVARVLRHPQVQLLLAAERVVADLR